ncbi:hypothetical protein [Cohnella sp. AR92]|uniref:hypothetical protein n=1 Tax=Cohnella sp. AR92 TaxID=648716 RepID=UPI000F8C6172|nr:hypothetical protein [Cohnella sp. AR92]RUS47611.1 hypothetical protein ELR57_07430 [Cohnella sp. AR92]
MKKKFIIGGVLLFVLIIIVIATNWASSKIDNEVINASKPYFAEMLIEYPKDIEIADAKVEKISQTDDFIKYNLTGYVEVYGLGVSEIDVEMHKNLKDSPMGEWVMKCNKCPARKYPPDDVNSDIYKKWLEIHQMTLNNEPSVTKNIDAVKAIEEQSQEPTHSSLNNNIETPKSDAIEGSDENNTDFINNANESGDRNSFQSFTSGKVFDSRFGIGATSEEIIKSLGEPGKPNPNNMFSFLKYDEKITYGDISYLLVNGIVNGIEYNADNKYTYEQFRDFFKEPYPDSGYFNDVPMETFDVEDDYDLYLAHLDSDENVDYLALYNK